VNKYQSDLVQDAIGDLNRAASKLGMVAAQLTTESQVLDGAERSAKVDQGLKLFLLGGQMLLALDRYKSPLNVLAVLHE